MATETLTMPMSANYPRSVVAASLPQYLANTSTALSGLGVSFKSMGPVTADSMTAFLSVRGEDVTAVFELSDTSGGTRVIGRYIVPKMNWLERKIVNGIFTAKQGEIERDFANFVRDQLQADGPGRELAS